MNCWKYISIIADYYRKLMEKEIIIYLPSLNKIKNELEKIIRFKKEDV